MFYNGFLKCEMNSVCNHLGYCDDVFTVLIQPKMHQMHSIKTAKMLAVACRLYAMIDFCII